MRFDPKLLTAAITAVSLISGAAHAADGSCHDPRIYADGIRSLKACRTLDRHPEDPRSSICLDGLSGDLDDSDQQMLNRYCRTVDRQLKTWSGDLQAYVRHQVSLLVSLAFSYPAMESGTTAEALWRDVDGPLATLMTAEAHQAFVERRFSGAALEAPYDAGKSSVRARVSGVRGLELREREQGSEVAVVVDVDLEVRSKTESEVQRRVALHGLFTADAATDLNMLGLLWDRFEWQDQQGRSP